MGSNKSVFFQKTPLFLRLGKKSGEKKAADYFSYICNIIITQFYFNVKVVYDAPPIVNTERKHQL